MALHFSGKQKAARVPLDYHERLDPRKWRLTLLCGVITLVCLGAAYATGFWRQVNSPGPVHSVHAAWENNCAACHVPLQPASGGNAIVTWAGVQATNDGRCETCHSGPPHHHAQKREEVANCSSCHREHRGRETSLVSLDDRTCTSCHAAPHLHVRDGQVASSKPVTRFDVDHPEFRIMTRTGERVALGSPEASDPGRLTFPHDIHLALGVRRPGQEKGWTLAMIPEGETRERYRRQQTVSARQDSDLVQLTCASCHQLDAGDTKASSPPRASGDYMLPINYDQHCRACHPMTFDARLKGVEIPHGLQPEAVRSFVWGAYADRVVKDAKKPEPSSSRRPLPGKEARELESKLKHQVDDEVQKVEGVLYQKQVREAERYIYSGQTTCGLCHQFQPGENDSSPSRVIPPAVPEVWFPHSSFSHRAHRAVDCKSCHVHAESSKNASDVLLVGVDSCKTCHAPRSSSVQGGFRHDCTTCHRYHQIDRPHGLGTSTRRGLRPLTPSEMQRGLVSD